MAMNFSSCSLFPSTIRPADDDCASAMRHRASDGRWTPYWLGWEMDDLYDYGQEADSHIEGSHDPADFLPSDPFGMELSNTFSAAIAGWINDIGADPGDYEVGDDDLVADLSYYWNHALSSSSSAPRYSSECAFDCWLEGGEYPGYYGYGYGYDVCCKEYSRSSGAEAAHSAGGGSVPHEGILFALRYLGVQDLLSVELVCKSLRSAVQNDTLLWRCIHIDSPLGGRITDDDLLRLTQRAQRSLECLNLAKCSRITDEGLKHVLESNPRLKKLGVAECLRLTTEGLIRNLKIFNSSSSSRITHLKMGRHFSVSPEQYEELRSLIDGEELSRPPKQRFFHTCLSSPPICADERAIDIELCRACQKFKLVFDCPSGCCQGKEDSELCRACDICIARCFECGRCITNRRYVETFLLDYLCGDCSGGPETQGEE